MEEYFNFKVYHLDNGWQRLEHEDGKVSYQKDKWVHYDKSQWSVGGTTCFVRAASFQQIGLNYFQLNLYQGKDSVIEKNENDFKTSEVDLRETVRYFGTMADAMSYGDNFLQGA